jgi:16S rRNA (guanine(527)-N(7))-methyltransferase RsmG
MEPRGIAELLQPFLPGQAVLSAFQLDQILTYIDILGHWNSRINLTAVRHPEEIVTRHFGESLFAASHLFPSATGRAGTGDLPVQLKSAAKEESPNALSASDDPPTGGDEERTTNGQRPTTKDQRRRTHDQRPTTKGRVTDVGSGAGFPGLPIKIWAPEIVLTLIESNHKKATFLREVCRSLTLTNVNVFAGRVEDHPPAQADVATLRAVEHFESVLPTAASLVAPGGRLALLIGRDQAEDVSRLAPALSWGSPAPMPNSTNRVLRIGHLPS